MNRFLWRRWRPQRGLAGVLGLLGWVALSCAPLAVAAVPSVADLVNQFSATNYFNLVSNKLYTRAGMNRAPVELGGAQHDLCRDAIHAEFQRVGLSPYLDLFSYVDTTNTTLVNVGNIIAVKEGVQNPNNEIWVVGSHYDSKANPGADDNATGVACQLEMARILAPHHFARTIIFAVYDAEERWEAGTGRHRLGSLRHAGQLLTNNVEGMLNVDMIGWQAPSPSHNRAFICGRPSFDAIRQDFRNAMLTYGSGLTPVITNLDNVGDHYSFEQAGISACMLLEAYYSSNPNYHKSTDYVERPGYLDWDYARKMCQSVIGFLAEKLQPVDVAPQNVSINASNGGVRINFTGLPRCQYATECCTNLVSPVWVALETNTAATDGSFTTLDAQAAGRPGAFYRARFVAGYVGNTGTPPLITKQPLSRVADAGDGVGLNVVAAGSAPLNYQWFRDGVVLAGATGSACTIASALTNQSGSYLVVVTNDTGSVTSRVATLTVHPPQTVVFADSFDTNSAALWTTNRSSSDTRLTFAYDYAADGIPSSPHAAGGATRGVKFEANLANGAAAAVCMSPTGRSFAGDYRLRFDMWINANGPFPLGGTGSTQFITSGLGTAGNRVQWTGAGSTADGVWFAANGEGQASDTTSGSSDFGAFVAATVQGVGSGVYAAGTDSNARGNGNAYYAAAFPGGQIAPAWQQANYPQQTGALAAGTVGFAWRDVLVARRGNVVEWSIDGVKLAAITNATLTASNVFVGYWDPFTSLSDNTAVSFGVIDNVRVEVPEP